MNTGIDAEALVFIPFILFERLNDNIAATTLELTGSEMQSLNAVSALPPEYPGWMVDAWVAHPSD